MHWDCGIWYNHTMLWYNKIQYCGTIAQYYRRRQWRKCHDDRIYYAPSDCSYRA